MVPPWRAGRGWDTLPSVTALHGAVRVHLLGTNGWYDSATGSTLCVAVEHPEFGVLLDAGSGLAKLDTVCPLDRPYWLLLTHLHLDHVSGLHVLVRLPFAAGLTIVVPDGQREPLERLLGPPFTVPPERLPYPTEVAELSAVANRLPFGLEALPLAHSVPTLGFRLTLDEQTLALVTDTGPCANAIRLARRADLLLAECSYRPGETHEGWPHLNPQLAAGIALEAEARRLVLLHFDASRYLTLEQREEARACAAGIFDHTVAGRDGMTFTLGC